MDNTAKLTINTNSKLGLGRNNTRIGNFNLPAVTTCPGASDLCKAKCYAIKGRWRCPNVVARAKMNLEGSQSPGFVESMVRQCRRVDVVRLHSSGDLHSPEYTRAWIEIARALPQVVFGAYTRSWVVDGFLSVLREFSALPNVQLFLSMDPTMGTPPDGFRHAYMHRDWERTPGSFRCPSQMAKERKVRVPTCVECMLCYKAPGKLQHVEFKEH